MSELDRNQYLLSMDGDAFVVVFQIVSHKVASVMKTKTEIEGILNVKHDFELVFDPDTGEYIIRRVPQAQMELFDTGLRPNGTLPDKGKEG